MSHNACCTRPAYTISLCSYYKIYRINYSGRFHNTLKLIKQDFDSWRGANATFLRGNVRAGEGKEEIPRSVGGIMGQVNSYVEVGQKAEDFAGPGWLAGELPSDLKGAKANYPPSSLAGSFHALLA